MAETNSLTEKVRPHVQALQDAAAKGDNKAQQVINLYQLYVNFPEPGAEGLCSAALDDWLKDQPPPADQKHGGTADMEWIRCWKCHGTGSSRENPVLSPACDICDGKGERRVTTTDQKHEPTPSPHKPI